MTSISVREFMFIQEPIPKARSLFRMVNSNFKNYSYGSYVRFFFSEKIEIFEKFEISKNEFFWLDIWQYMYDEWLKRCPSLGPGLIFLIWVTYMSHHRILNVALRHATKWLSFRAQTGLILLFIPSSTLKQNFFKLFLCLRFFRLLWNF